MIDSDIRQLGVVVIGRNEGARLMTCLQSLLPLSKQIVYVDSGSTDASVTQTQALSVEVVALDLTIPFTAARARNAGAKKLLTLYPKLQFIQFVDGDCEVNSSWLTTASAFLAEHSQIAVVCGRRRERYPEKSIYNYQCDIEWNTPTGEAKACGGDCLVRVTVFNAVQGYYDALIAGEEPEMCIRMRALGWLIWRLDVEMTLHDANITHFQQWWWRNVRSGYAFVEGAYLHGAAPERHWVKETIRALVWGVLLPISILILLLINFKYALLLSLIYPAQWLRMAYKHRYLTKRWSFSLLMLLAKFAEGFGLIKFLLNQILNKRGELIEYK